MPAPLLYENEKKRLEIPLRLLLCFAMFCVWQMGIIYYICPALNIDGRTPLPIPADNLTLLIVLGYVCSIGTMLLFPRSVIWLCRGVTAVSLFTAVGLFLPAENTVLTVFIYVQCFCCCYMIGFESATMVHYMNSRSVTRHLLAAYPIGYILIAFIQSDFLRMDFSVFRILMVVMLTALLVFYVRFPVDSGIRFVQKTDGLVIPKRLTVGFMLLAFLGALLGVIAPAAVAAFEHGVFAAYIGCAAASLLLYLLYKKTGRHPICWITTVIGITAIGYTALVLSAYVPGLGLLVSVLMGCGMSVCALLPLFALLVVRQYPSRWIVPGYIALAMLAVIVQSVLVEVFRDAPALLHLAYLCIILVMAILYILLEPFLIYSMRRKFEEVPMEERLAEPDAASEEPKPLSENMPENPLTQLTKRETEIVELINCGHSNRDIAGMLFISENTVKDHTKNIYRKLGVHSRYELIALVNRIKK